MRVAPTRRGNAHPSIVPYEVFKAADDIIKAYDQESAAKGKK